MSLKHLRSACTGEFFLQSARVDHHGGEPYSKHLGLSLPGSGVRGRRIARKPLSAFTEARLGLHAGQLH